MLDFQRIDLSKKERYNRYLRNCGERGCEYSLVNLCLWGRQRVALLEDGIALFSQFQRSSVYPFPLGSANLKEVLDAIIHDARARGLECRLTSMTATDCAKLEEYYPGQFRFHTDRDSCDYIYHIDHLADLSGRKYQRKRNHVNRFWLNHPDCMVVPMDKTLLPAVKSMTDQWYANRQTADNPGEYHLEQRALCRAFAHFSDFELDGLVLMEHGQILAMTIGSLLNDNTFDIHFEKALEEIDGAYAVINQEFASYLRKKYPSLHWLNREDDMGLPGLRKAKLSYYPDHLVVKFWANLLEDEDED